MTAVPDQGCPGCPSAPRTAGRTRVTEMKETSMTSSVGLGASMGRLRRRAPGARRRALVRS